MIAGREADQSESYVFRSDRVKLSDTDPQKRG